jgi:phenylalanyl-tRNA synthetase beta chain
MPAETRQPNAHQALRSRVRDLMSGFGFCEAITYSFIGADACDRLRLPGDDIRRRVVAIENPLSEDQAVMRPSLIPGLLESMGRNTAQQIKSMRLFEIGKVFIGADGEALPRETETLSALWSGLRGEASWLAPETAVDFFDLKGALEGLLAALGVSGMSFAAVADNECTCTRPGRSARVLCGGRPIGLLGEVHPEVLRAYGLKQSAYVFELDLDTLAGSMTPRAYCPVPRYPAVTRDMTLIVDAGLESGRLLEHIRALKEPLLESVSIFDVFSGAPIDPGKKSVSLRLTYRSPEKTLAESEVGQHHQSITKRLITQYNADLPG